VAIEHVSVQIIPYSWTDHSRSVQYHR